MAAGYSISITAVDGATATIDRLNKRLATLTAPAERFTRSVSKFADVSGVAKLTQGMQSLGNRSMDAFRAMDRIVPTLATITGALSLAGMAAMVQHWATLGQEVANTGQRLGIPVDHLSALRNTATLAGSSAGALTDGLGALDEKLRGATFRGDSTAIQTFRAIGVSFGQIGSKARTADEAFSDVAAGIKRLYDTQGRGAALRAAQNLGLEGLFPMLLKSRKELAALAADNRRLGGVITPEMAAEAEKLNNAFNRVSIAATGFGNAIANALAPAVRPLLDWMAELIADNRLWIAQDVGAYAKKLADWIRQIKWQPVITEVKEFWTWIEKVTQENWTPTLDAIKSVTGTFSEAKDGIITLKGQFTELQSMLDSWNVPEWLKWLNTISSNAGKSLHDWLTGANTNLNPDGSPASPSGKDERTLIERLYKPGPGLLPGQEGPATRGERNHNPLNLSFNNQPGATSDGRFAVFDNDETGFMAATRQLVVNQEKHGLNTVAGQIARWAPASDGNDTAGYSAQVAKRLGVDVNAPIDVHDPEVARAMVAAMARRETGREYDPAAVQRGVFAGLGRVAPLAAAAPAADTRTAAPPAADTRAGDGKVAVQVSIVGAPAGTRVSATSSGIAHMPTAPKVAGPLPMFGW